MKLFLRYSIIAVSIAIIAPCALSSQPLRGIVNNYAPVDSITQCGVRILYSIHQTFFKIGDKAVLIQMRGASVDTSNTPNFGSILSYENCGNFEIVTIGSINDKFIGFKNKLKNRYSPETKSVQLVTIARYENATIDSLSGGLYYWPGDREDFYGFHNSVGGVIALEVTGTLSFHGNICASNLGFESNGFDIDIIKRCADLNFKSTLYTNPEQPNGAKGQGIAILTGNTKAGRGRRANGGGGGNQARSGGGGGGNGGAGGHGGNDLVECGSVDNGGIGGAALSYNFSPLRVFLGGGGGEAARYASGSNAGQDGGGIVILIANKIEGNGYSIIADGNHSTLSNKIEHGGGGGGGGTVLISCDDIASPLTIDVSGGKGEDDHYKWDSDDSKLCMGPGGGGGGGVVGFSSSSVPANVTVLKSGGQPGIIRYGVSECLNTNYGATAGEDGIILTGIKIPESDTLIGALSLSMKEIDFGDLRCDDERTQSLTVNNLSNYPAQVDTIIHANGDYSVTISSDKIDPHGSALISVKFKPGADGDYPDTLKIFYPNICDPYLQVILKGSRNSIKCSADTPLDLGILCRDEAQTGYLNVTNLSNFSTTLVGEIEPLEYFSLPNNNFSAPFASGESRMVKVYYKGGAGKGNHVGKLTITDSCGGDKTVDVTVAISDFKIDKKKDVNLCKNANEEQLSEEYYSFIGGVGRISYEWTPEDNLSDASSAYPLITNPKNGTYTLTAKDSLGCIATMDIKVSLLDGAELEIIPDSVYFGEIDSCQANKEATIEIENIGARDVELIPNFDTQEFSVLETISIEIQSGQKKKIRIRYSRTGENSGPIVTKLTLIDKICGEFEIGVTAEVLPFSIKYTDSVNFGVLSICEDSLKSFIHVRNIAPNDTLKLGIARFAVTPTPFTCLLVDNAHEVFLESGEAITSPMAFLKAPEGTYANVILIPYVLGDCTDTLRIPIIGKIEDNFEIAYTKNIVFPKIVDCETESESYVYIKNIGIAKVDSIVATDSSFLEFENKPEFTSGLLQGDSIAFKVKLKPKFEGDIAGKIFISVFIGNCEKTIEIPYTAEKEGFSFVAPTALDFGDFLDCDLKKTIEREITLRANTSSIALITHIAVGGDFVLGKNFETDLSVGNLPAKVDNLFKCRFLPDTTGIYSGYIDVEIEPCNTKFRIELTAKVLETGLTELHSKLDFGEIQMGEQAKLVAAYCNLSDVEITIDNLINPASPFTVLSVSPPLPCLLKPGDTLKIEVAFVSDIAGDFLDSVRFVAQPCNIFNSLSLKDAVRSDLPQEVEIIVGDASGKAGDLVPITISLKTGGVRVDGIFKYRATIKFNKALLAPKCEALKDSLGEHDRYLTFEGETAIRDTTLKTIPCVAALGNASSTPIELVEFEWIDKPYIDSRKKHGKFTLTDICEEGGERLFNSDGRIDAPLIKPNPTTGEVEVSFTAIESGETKLVLYDAKGKQVRILFDGGLNTKDFVLKVNLSDLPAGVYFMELKTSTQEFSTKLVLDK